MFSRATDCSSPELTLKEMYSSVSSACARTSGRWSWTVCSRRGQMRGDRDKIRVERYTLPQTSSMFRREQIWIGICGASRTWTRSAHVPRCQSRRSSKIQWSTVLKAAPKSSNSRRVTRWRFILSNMWLWPAVARFQCCEIHGTITRL